MTVTSFEVFGTRVFGHDDNDVNHARRIIRHEWCWVTSMNIKEKRLAENEECRLNENTFEDRNKRETLSYNLNRRVLLFSLV